MADEGLFITDPSIPSHFANELGLFAGKAREILRLIDARLHAALDSLADRKAYWKQEIRERQQTYESADEDDRTSAYRALAEAEDCLRDVRHWEGQLRTAAEQYRRRVSEMHDLLDQCTPKAQGALRDHTDLLYAYLAVPAPGAGGSSGFSAGSMGTTAPTAAQVLVSGFEHSPFSGNAAVYELLKAVVPAAHLDPGTLKSLTYEDRYEEDSEGILMGFTVHGSKYDDISILRHSPDGSCAPDSMLATIAHEIGHHVQNHLLPEIRVIHWQQIYSRTPSGRFVTTYASKDASEDFSESYSAYIYDPGALLRVSTTKYVFFRDHVFFGREYL